MIVAGIESSCDETAVACIKDGNQVLSSIVSSQIKIHRPFGGVIPEIAAREHLKSIDFLFHEALKEAGILAEHIDLISVTRGPGLVGALLVGVSFAKGLALSLNRPLIGVDHVHAHVHGALLGLPDSPPAEQLFPALALVVSGGHTNLYFMENPVSFRLAASTADDACGECFDKVARLMGLGYPGGPEIEKAASGGDPERFPMPKIASGSLPKTTFSYSGLKTHAARQWEKHGGLQDKELRDFAASFQYAAFDQLRRAVTDFLDRNPGAVRSVLVAGGVSANHCFREMMSELPDGLPCLFPAPAWCSDNAAMVAALGGAQYLNLQEKNLSLPSPDSWDVYPRYQYQLHGQSQAHGK